MALATTCPQCKTSFRVVPDQLKLRRGLVRCGVCRHVFSGIDSLRYVEDAQRAPSPDSPPDSPPVSAAAATAAWQPGALAQWPGVLEPEPIEPEPIEPEPVEPEPVELEPVEARVRRDAQDGLSAAAPSPAAATAPREDADEQDAVDFFAPDRRAGGFSSRGAAFASVASVALAALLALQLVIGARDWLASRVPALAPGLSAALGPLGLRVQPPREPGALTIESFELQPAGDPSLFALGALLRNRTGHVVQWPALELSLLDGAGEVVVRKVLDPADYLVDAPDALRDGVRARAEVPMRAAIEVRDVAPTGYRVRIVGP